MTIAIDAATPTAVSASTTAVSTASSTPPAAGCLGAVVGVVGNSTGASARTGVLTDSLGTSYTSALMDSYSRATGDTWEGIWLFDIAASAAARTFTLTGTGGTNAKGVLLVPLYLTGAQAAALALGATLHFNTLTGSLTVGTANSFVLAACGTNNSNKTYTAATNNTLLKNFADATNGEGYSIVRSTSMALATGAFLAGVGGGTVDTQFGAAAWEIKAAPAVTDFVSSSFFFGS